MVRGFLRFVKLFRLEQIYPKARRPRPTVRFELEGLSERILLSASPVGQPPTSTPMVALMDRAEQMIVVVQNEASSFVRTIAQEIVQELAYLELQLDHIFGIDTASQNPSLNSSMRPAGNGLGNIVTIASNASNQVSNNGAPQAGNGSGSVGSVTIKPQDSPSGPDAIGASDYTWNPTDGTILASHPQNWLVNEGPNLNNTLPGSNPGDTVTLDPGDQNAPNGARPITWDYNATFSSMNITGQNGKAYDNVQKINTGVKVELTGGSGTSLTMSQTQSELNLTFRGTAVFQIDNNATITNMELTGDSTGQFNINGGITTMASAGAGGFVYVENIGVQFYIAKGAEVDDLSHNKLLITSNNTAITIAGKMLVYFGDKKANTLIDHAAGTSGDYLDVSGGTLEYAGNSGIMDTFTVPVFVNGGHFIVTSAPNWNAGAYLIVQGSSGVTQNASVYMVSGTVQLSQGVTLEADSDYRQDSGTLETTDKSSCVLWDGPNGTGLASINGGTVWIDTNANEYGKLSVLGDLNFSGELDVSIQGYAQQQPPAQGTSDLLYVGGTLYLEPESSSLYVHNYGAQKGDYWAIINSPNNISGGFRTVTINPDAPLLYGINGGNYEISY